MIFVEVLGFSRILSMLAVVTPVLFCCAKEVHVHKETDKAEAVMYMKTLLNFNILYPPFLFFPIPFAKPNDFKQRST